MKKENVVKFDINYQTKLLSNLCQDEKYFLKIHNILPVEFFDTDSHRWVYKFLKEYFIAYKKLPDWDTIIAGNNIINPETVAGHENLLRQTISLLIKQLIIIHIDVWIQDTTRIFCVEQTYKEVLSKCIDYLQDGDYDSLQVEFQSAIKKLDESDKLSYDYFQNISDRLKEDFVDRTGTGWPLIDKYVKNGIANGEFAVVMAPTGVGKSFFLVNIAYGALVQKKDVVYLSLELNEKNIANRLDAIISETSLNDLYSDAVSVEEKVQRHKEQLGNFHIVYFTKKPTLNDIKLKLIQLKSFLNIDMVIIDYADMIKVKKTGQKRWDMEEIYEDISFLAKEMDVKIWSASQSNRCLGLDTVVTVKSKGDIKIKFIEVGDEILTHSGYNEVLGKYENKSQPMYKIKLKNGKELIVSDKHEFPTIHGGLKSIMAGLKIGDKLFCKKYLFKELSLDYKQELELNINNFELSEIISIKSIGNRKSIDIEVKNTHMFYANDIYTHNSGAESDLIDLTHLSEAYSKAFPTTLFITFTRTFEDEKFDRGRFFIVKNRLGPKNMIFEVHFKNEMSKINVTRIVDSVNPESQKGEYNTKQKEILTGSVERIMKKKNLY